MMCPLIRVCAIGGAGLMMVFGFPDAGLVWGLLGYSLGAWVMFVCWITVDIEKSRKNK